MRKAAILCLALSTSTTAWAQQADESEEPPRRAFIEGGFDDKPYLLRKNMLSLGGYIDAQARFMRADGFTDQATMLLERLNLFTFATVSERVRVISELEIEDGGQTLVVELGAVDVELATAAIFRAGVLLVPIGRFNLSHDSPANIMVDRPLTSTELIPGTMSEAGFGFYGSFDIADEGRLTYETYLVNGLGSGIANDSMDGTRFGDGKPNLVDENHHPSLVARVAYSPIRRFELAASGYVGPWNVWDSPDGALDKKRWLGITAIDAVANLGWARFAGELVHTFIDLPPHLPSDVFAQMQRGLFLEASIPVLRDMSLYFPNSEFQPTARYEYVDRNAEIDGDSIHRLSLGFNWLPSPETVLKLNYQRTRSYDQADNPEDGAGLQLGVASYF